MMSTFYMKINYDKPNDLQLFTNLFLPHLFCPQHDCVIHAVIFPTLDTHCYYRYNILKYNTMIKMYIYFLVLDIKKVSNACPTIVRHVQSHNRSLLTIVYNIEKRHNLYSTLSTGLISSI